MNVIQAKLNITNMMENSKTIDDIIKSPEEGSYLKLNDSKSSSIRKKSPKEIKIEHIPEDTDIYQEINVLKGKAAGNKNFIVNKVFKKKKNVVNYILKRKVPDFKCDSSKIILSKPKIFKKANKAPLLMDRKNSKKLQKKLAEL
mmetsp:Transcript_32756/g.29040  ORF Transcript_32756/g.29040 Transcript_32756/m.29040 type:complete len:144 (+) Transcript_32756:464-895(+)